MLYYKLHKYFPHLNNRMGLSNLLSNNLKMSTAASTVANAVVTHLRIYSATSYEQRKTNLERSP